MEIDSEAYITTLIERGVVTRDQVDECVRVWKEITEHGQTDTTLLDVLVLKGYLPAHPEDLALEEQGRTFGRYVIDTRLGSGGMGVVLLARRSEDGAPVALKILPERYCRQDEFVLRFEREAKIALQLSHPNLVRAYEYGEIGGRWFYAMEYVRGRTVGEILKSEGRMEEGRALGVALAIAEALGEISRRGLVHRDIKPSNIILTEEGGVKLADLGLAKPVGSDVYRLTGAGKIMGTPHYMAPEQIMGGRDLDVRTDIYSLGATLYHMTTGERPFAAKNSFEAMQRQLFDPELWPQAVHPELSDGIRRVITRMMARSPLDRYLSVQDLIVDLRRVLNGETPLAPPLKRGQSMVTKRVEASPAPRSNVRFSWGLAIVLAAGVGLAVGVALLLLLSKSG
jgi:serine/threonine protein kinase